MANLQFSGLSDKKLLSEIESSAAEARRCDIQLRHFDALKANGLYYTAADLKRRRTFSANKVNRLEAQAETRYEITRLPRAIEHAIESGNSTGENQAAEQLVSAGVAASFTDALDLIYSGDN